MIAIAGTIGTGLFLGSGKAISNGGPVGALLGYTFVGLLVGCMMYSLGEMMVYDPSKFAEACFFVLTVDMAANTSFDQALVVSLNSLLDTLTLLLVSPWDGNSGSKLL